MPMWLYAGNILTIHRPALFRTQDAALAAWPHTIRAAATHRRSEHRMANPVVCPVPRSTTGLPPGVLLCTVPLLFLIQFFLRV